MKPESVKRVERALMDADDQFRTSGHINSRGSHLAKAAIRAVLQTDEIRELLRHASSVIASAGANRTTHGWMVPDYQIRSLETALAVLAHYGKSQLQSTCDAVEDMRELQREAALAELEAK